MKDLTIRTAKKSDYDAIQSLWKKVIEKAFEQEDFDSDKLNPQKELEFKMDQLNQAFSSEHSTFFVAYDNGRLIGTIAYGTPPNRGIMRRTDGELKDHYELGSLYIDPALQKKGYGKHLLVHALKHLRSRGIEEVCFDSIYEVSKNIWRKIFGEPRYQLKASWGDFYHMIWVKPVKAALEDLDA